VSVALLFEKFRLAIVHGDPIVVDFLLSKTNRDSTVSSLLASESWI
jgi:hypothetical protein